MAKSTEELLHELVEANNVGDYLQRNNQEFKSPDLGLYLRTLLVEKNCKRSEIIRAANLEMSYGYRLFEGSKLHPGRDKVLAIAIAFHLTVPETNHLLKYAGLSELYPKERRDSIIQFSLQKEYDLNTVNQTLASYQCPELDLVKE
jgi:hypothetical protein